jgi:Ubiquitin carboxyl-terminal hydrolase
MHTPDMITTPVAPVRKVRRRALTLDTQDSRGRTRIRERAKSPTESDSSENDIDDEDGIISKDSSKTSLPTTESSSLPTFQLSDLSASAPPAPLPSLTIPRPSVSTAPPRYILRKAFKRMKLQSPLPPVMILHLKRFYGTYTGSMKKLDDFVSFETEFDFSPFVFPPSPKKSKMLYRLTGVVIHLGSINSGQYSPFLTILIQLCIVFLYPQDVATFIGGRKK